jgi:hypothetical protein
VSGHDDGFVVCPTATRLDVKFIAGDPIDLTVPILDRNDEPVPIASAAGWSGGAQIRRHWAATTVLHSWTTEGVDANAEIVPGPEGAIRLTATGAETAAWQSSWPEFNAHWDIEVSTPDTAESPQTIAAGRIRLRPQYTR